MELDHEEEKMSAPNWLKWARQLQSIGQEGLTYCTNPYDLHRYHSIIGLAAAMMSAQSGTANEAILSLFKQEHGYLTPKVDVRGALFDQQGRVLLVREVMDSNRWTLPGGWADVNLTPADNVIKEVFEETGYKVVTRKLAAVLDRDKQGHPPGPFSVYKLFFVCDIVGGSPTTSHEISEVRWFAQDSLPEDLSLERTTMNELSLVFEQAREKNLPTPFD